MRKALQFTVRTAALTSGLLILVAIPQLFCAAIGAPVTF